MPNSSRSNSSAPSRMSNRINDESPAKRKNSSRSRSASPKKQRKNSSCSRSNKSVKSAQNTVAQIANHKKRSVANSSIASRSRSKSPPAAKKRSCPNSSRSRSPQVRQKVKRNSSDKSNSSKGSNKNFGSNKNNNYSPERNNFGNRDNNDGQFRGRGRGRGRGDRGRGRGGFNNNGQRNYNNNRDNDNNGGGFNRDNNNGYGNRQNNFNRNNNFNNNNNRFNNNNNDRFNNNNNNGYGNNSYNNNNNNNNYGSNNQRSPNLSNSFNSHNSPPQNNRSFSPHSPLKIEQPKKTPQQIRLQQFYNAHKEQGWFKEKYNPVSLITQENQRFLYIKKAQEEFLTQLNSGYYDQISLTIADYKALGNLEFQEVQDGQLDEKKMTSIVTLYLNDNIKIQGPPFYGIQKDSSTLYIPDVSKEIYRYDIYEAVSDIEGFKNLILNEPQRKLDFKRMAWIEYEDEQKAVQALEKLKEIEIKGKKLEFTRACKRIRKAKTIINYPESRIQQDLKNMTQIAAKLDYESKVYQKNTLYEHKFNSQLKKLEVFLTYLRKVHFFDYFESRFYDSFRTLTIKSGMTVLLVKPDSDVQVDIEELKKLDVKNAIVKEKGSTEYRKKAVENINLFTQLIKEGLYKIHQFNPNTQEQPRYWKCHECRKKFLTIVHLIKHTTSRHEDIIEKEVQEAMMKIYLKNEEQWEKNKGERQARQDRQERRKKVRKVMKDFDCPQQEQDQELRQRLRPVSQTKKLINFLDI